MENFIGADLLNDALEGIGVDAYSSPILVKIAIMPVIEEGQL